jgi:hypothetical protein
MNEIESFPICMLHISSKLYAKMFKYYSKNKFNIFLSHANTWSIIC